MFNYKKVTKNDIEVKTLCDNQWLSLKEINSPENHVSGYVFSHEERCQGKIISILPYRIVDDKYEFLLRKEVTPSWSMDPKSSTITGGCEKHQTPLETAIMELEEEAGYIMEENDMIFLGNSHGSKSSDTIYYLFSVNLTGKEQGEAIGDGTFQDTNGTVEWVSGFNILGCFDPQASVLYVRLMAKLGEI